MYSVRPRPSMNLTAMGAMLMVNMLALMPPGFRMRGISSGLGRRPGKTYATMASPDPQELAAWNEAVRQKKLVRLSRRIDARLQRIAPQS